MRRRHLLTLLLVVGPRAATGQSLIVQAGGVVATHNEVVAVNQVDGFGGAVGATLEWKRLGVEAFGYLASVTPATPGAVPDFTIMEMQFHARYALNSTVGLEAGYIRRAIDPEFAAQDIGAFSIGARLQSRLAGVAEMYVRGGFVPIASFNGGGSGGLAYQIGLGLGVGPQAAKWRITAHYDFQRYGRTVRSTDVPIQVEVARIGVAYAIR